MKKNSYNEIKKKHVLFYSSVKTKELFNIQRFYKTDIQILENLGYGVILSNRIIDACKFWRYDFVFAYFYRYSLFVAIIAKLFGKNTYFTGGIDNLDRNLVSAREYIIQKYLFGFCYYFSKSCIIVSKTDRENVRRILNGRKLSYSEHTIDTKQFDCELSYKQKFCTTIVWQATVANVERKGVDTTLRLFAMLHQFPQYKDYKLFIIGKKGEGTLYLQKLVSELEIEDAVVFTDSITEEEKIDYLKKSRLYFQLSKFEGFGVAAIEALCAKNIVIHSGRGGLSNPIYNDGIFVNIDQTIEQMYNVLKKDLETFEEAKLEAAHQNVCKYYDNERRKEDFSRIIIEG